MKVNTIAIFGTTFLNFLFRFSSTLILTRILAPEAYALVGIVSTIVFVIELLSDVGIRSYILKYESKISNKLIECLWTIQIIRGVLLTLFMLVLAYPLDAFLEIKDLFLAICIVSPSFLLTGFKSLNLYIEDRNNKPLRPLLIEFFASTTSIMLVIVTTVIFKTKWCMVLAQLYTPLLITILSHIAYRQESYKLRFDKMEYFNFFSWSKFIAASSLITIFLVQADKIILAKTMTESELGLYFMAVTLASIPLTLIINYSARVIAPAIANAKQNNVSDLMSYFYQNKNKVTIFCLISLAFGIIYSDIIIEILYDPRYTGVSIYLALLLYRAVLCTLTNPLENFLVVMGFVRTNLICNIIRILFIGITAIPAYHYYSAFGLILVFSLSELPALIYLYYITHKKKFLRISTEIFYIFLFSICFLLFYSIEKPVNNFLHSLLINFT